MILQFHLLTNEQDACIMKGWQQIIADFTMFFSTKNFCHNRSIISTAIKNDKNALDPSRDFNWLVSYQGYG
jgi:hypothetical protein